MTEPCSKECIYRFIFSEVIHEFGLINLHISWVTLLKQGEFIDYNYSELVS